MKKTTNRYFTTPIFICLCLQLISCNSFEKKSLTKASDNCVFLVDSISNSSKIKVIGNVQNLEILNGIKGFQFGMSSKLLNECIILSKLDNQFRCGVYQNSFNFQGINWPVVLLVYENDKLIGVELSGKVVINNGVIFSSANDGSPFILQRNFNKLLGFPNYKPLTIVEKDLRNTSLYMTYDFKDKKPIRESLSSLLAKLSHTELETSSNPIQISISDIANNYENHNKPQAYKLHLDYYESLKISSSWESSTFLKIDYTRNRIIDTPVSAVRKYNGNTVVAYSSYNYNDTWDINISMFENRSLYNSFKRIREQDILQKAKEKAQNENIENSKKIIDGF